jgi:tripartite-type tricarboxylate transporter receptor subunit TctC
MRFTRRTVAASLAALAAALPFAVAAQAYPNKPIKVIVPFAAGSTTDIIARAISDKMSQSLGQQLVVENIGQIRNGQLLALAVGSPKRAAALPDVPTTAEAGVPGSEFNFWIGMFAPAKTPKEIVDRLQAEVVKALNTTEVKERFTALGADAWTLKPAEFDAYIREEIKANAALVKAAGLEVQK